MAKQSDCWGCLATKVMNKAHICILRYRCSVNGKPEESCPKPKSALVLIRLKKERGVL